MSLKSISASAACDSYMGIQGCLNEQIKADRGCYCQKDVFGQQHDRGGQSAPSVGITPQEKKE